MNLWIPYLTCSHMLDTDFQQNVSSWKKKKIVVIFFLEVLFPSATKDQSIRKLNVSLVPLIEWLPFHLMH